MIDPVELEEQRQNSGIAEAYYDGLDARAGERADELMTFSSEVCNASDYPLFFSHLTLALTATSNEERLRWLATMRDCVWERIKSEAIEELRKSDLGG